MMLLLLLMLVVPLCQIERGALTRILLGKVGLDPLLLLLNSLQLGLKSLLAGERGGVWVAWARC